MAENRQTPTVHHVTHGNSVAAWTAVGLMMVGFLIMSLAVAMTTLWMFIAGAVVIVAAAVVGKVMSAMGFGVTGKPGT